MRSGGVRSPRDVSQRLAYGLRDETVHGAAFAETDLLLGRLYGHVDGGRVDRPENQAGGLPVAVKHVGVGLPDGVGDDAVAHVASIDIQILLVGAGPRKRGPYHHAA